MFETITTYTIAALITTPTTIVMLYLSLVALGF